MILSRGRNYVFIHIPKTGGTALALALEARAMADDEMLGDTPKARKRRHRISDVKTRGRLWKHSTLADIEGLASRADLRQMFTFTLVRNPWDRAVSLYHWLQTQRFDHPLVPLAQRLSFTSFITHPLVMRAFAETPASSYMRQSDGQEHCSLYIRLEHFASDARPLFDHLGFALDLPRVNDSNRQRDWRIYYDSRAIDAVRQCCATDIAAFEYSFNDSPLSL
ncbi:sulfotransferase family 2 domain-containing protein [Phaeobacter sp. HF9A]|uniref:sulfotransferase family 2 domain-containing protein n=1 Tax=Phaeobacter sp. HF9A TaxID=2721561 RepID=UPI00142FBB38|nr:sulfotransferase family 2 domain-containing protein [Phaeobacter sp. HF9A]NIZ14356.1 sulfotransferase family protein [Phaeobacter sp. HF9A]